MGDFSIMVLYEGKPHPYLVIRLNLRLKSDGEIRNQDAGRIAFLRNTL